MKPKVYTERYLFHQPRRIQETRTLEVIMSVCTDVCTDTQTKTRALTRTYLVNAGCADSDAGAIEDDIYNACQKHSNSETYDLNDPESNDFMEYILKCKKVIYNVPHVLKSKEKGTLSFDLKHIARQSDIVIRPEKWKAHIQRSELIRKQQSAVETASTDQFKCGKCGKKETTYYTRQTRGMDEPETVFITCVKCGNKWRQ